MKKKYPYSPALKLFYLGDQDAIPDDVVFLTHEEMLVISANQSGGNDTSIDAYRKNAYTAEVDPLIAEATIKRAMGLDAEAKKLMASALAKRLEIQQLYPKKTKETA